MIAPNTGGTLARASVCWRRLGFVLALLRLAFVSGDVALRPFLFSLISVIPPVLLNVTQ